MGMRQVPFIVPQMLTYPPHPSLSAMAGKPFKVGRFAHTLRVRLMREHLGVDVDSMSEEGLMATEPQEPMHDQQPWDPDQEERDKDNVTHTKETKSVMGLGTAVGQGMSSQAQVRYIFALTDGLRQVVYALGDIVHTDVGKAVRKVTREGNDREPLESNTGNESLGKERTMESRDHERVDGFPSSIVPTMEEKVVMDVVVGVGNAQPN